MARVLIGLLMLFAVCGFIFTLVDAQPRPFEGAVAHAEVGGSHVQLIQGTHGHGGWPAH
jgi:hypothetical protein